MLFLSFFFFFFGESHFEVRMLIVVEEQSVATVSSLFGCSPTSRKITTIINNVVEFISALKSR